MNRKVRDVCGAFQKELFAERGTFAQLFWRNSSGSGARARGIALAVVFISARTSRGELLLQFEKIEKLPEAKKQLVKEFLDAFILKSNLQQQLT